MGLVVAPLFSVILAGVEDHEAGTASGVLNAVQQLDAAVGVAVVGTVLFGLLGSQAGGAAASQAPKVRAALVTAGVTGRTSCGSSAARTAPRSERTGRLRKRANGAG
jgi:hypothetical protein